MKIGTYVGLHVEDREIAEIDDVELENYLEYALDSVDVYDTKEGVSEEGDKVVLEIVTYDSEGKIEKPFDENFTYLVGCNKFPPVEPKVLGVKTGDKFEFEMPIVKDPNKLLQEEYETATFHCTVLRVEERVQAELTEELAKAIGYESILDLREKVREQLRIDRQHDLDDRHATKIINHIRDNSEVETDEKVVEKYKNMLIENQYANIKNNGLTKEKYFEINELTEESFIEQMGFLAKSFAEVDVILAEIARLENINLTEDYVNQEIDEYVNSRGITRDDLDEQTISGIEEQALRILVKNFLLAHND